MNPTVFTPHYALVTGSAKRLGREIAIALAKAGWNIVLHYHRSESEALRTQEELQGLGVDCVTVQADLGDEGQVRALFAQACASRAIRCVVNNASLFEYDSGTDFSPQLLDAHMRTNVQAPLLLSRLLYEHTPSDANSVVVNLLDQKLTNLNPDFLSYTLSKAALKTATLMLATELAPRLRVVGVSPGLTMISHLQSEDQFSKTHRLSPLGRSSTPADIAAAVLYLVSSPAVTGIDLLVDGGQHLLPMGRDFSMMNP